MLLRGECLQDLRGDAGAPQRRRRGGAGQGLGGVREQQEAGGAAVEAEGGQGRGEARHLGLPRHPHLQTRPQARHRAQCLLQILTRHHLSSSPHLAPISLHSTHAPHLTLVFREMWASLFLFLIFCFCVTFTSV